MKAKSMEREGFFSKVAKATEKNVNDKIILTSSKYGREITTIENAKKQFYKSHERKNPIPYIEKCIEQNKTFYGFIHGGANDGKVFALDENSTTMEIYVGSTGTGKGVFLGNKALEAMKKKKGLIIVDPKKDAFLPQICLEELTRQSRADDFQVCSWENNFGYMGINEFDTYKDVANKFIDALDLSPSDSPGVDYYRKNGRILLNKVLKLFFDGDLGVIVKKDFKNILFHLQMLKEDMEKQELLEKEIGKLKPNNNLIEKYKKRYYDLATIENIYWDTTTIETLDSLVKSISEIAESAHIYKKYDLTGALYEGKVLYLKVDMLDPASLKMIKMMVTDAIQQARRKKANTTIIADELSFYANQTIAGALATIRSMGLKFLLALQDLSQMKEDHIRNAILSNCNVKMFYKISDKQTLEYVEKIGGKDAVSMVSINDKSEKTIRQQLEEVMNTTKIRSLPRQGVGIVIAEEMNEPVIVRTNFIEVLQEFDWDLYEYPEKTDIFSDLDDQKIIKTNDQEKIERYKIEIGQSELLENSELFGISYTSEAI